MKPYFNAKNLTLYNCDYKDFLKQNTDRFDLLFTDPPYGIGISKRKHICSGGARAATKNNVYKTGEWDTNTPESFDDLFAITDKQIIFGANYFSDKLPQSGRWLVWDKGKTNGIGSDGELIYTRCSDGNRVQFVRHVWHGMIQEDMKNKETRYHIAQKPVELCVSILNLLKIETCTLFEPFAGVGGIVLAAIQLGFTVTACEIDAEYCDILVERYEELGCNRTQSLF